MKQKILLLVLLSLFVIPICGINGLTNNNTNEFSPDAMIPFEKWSYVDTSDFSDPPCIADIDNDGDKEILGCIGGTQALRCYNHLGQLVWGKTYGTGLTSPVAANLLYDENLEIILGVYDTIYCEAYDGQTNFWTYLADSNIYNAPTIADLHNDSSLEVIFSTTGGSVYCLDKLGDLMWSYTISGHSFYTSPVVFDIDKDGSLEILLSPHHGEYIYCLNNNGTLKWQGYVSDGGGKRLGVADLEGDGSYEIITVQEGLLICFNNTGGLMYNRTVPSGTLHPPVFADLYNNGTLEVLIFRGIDVLSCYSSNLFPIWSVYCPAYLYKYAISDIDDNGFIDIIYGRSDYIVCLDYTGAEQWSFPLEGTNAEPHYPVISDIDNDGFADIIYSHYIPTGQLSSIRCITFSGITQSSKQQWCTDRGSVFHTGFLDSDGDFIDDLTEEYLQTNKSNEDTDEDNIDDGYEFLYYHTNPTTNDTDQDIMPDHFEIINNLDPINPSDGTEDPDSDNLLNYEEYLNNTDLFDPDTDNDGMEDGWEVSNDFNPLLDDSSGDPDSDELNNLGEFLAGTNPHLSDTDNDTIPDGFEVTGGIDPLRNDTMEDPDNDNLNNLAEYGYGTNPTSSDTDGDNTPDDWEIANGFNPLIQDSDEDPDLDDLDNYGEYLNNTDPNIADTDADGLFDGAEILIYNTDPLLNDTDGDGYLDGIEVDAGSDPLNKFSFPGSSSNGSSKWWISFIVIVPIFGISLYILQRKGIFARKTPPDVLEEPKPAKKILEKNCFVCGQPLGEGDKKCSSCKSDVFKCNTCKLPINFGESIAVCSKCGSIGHQNHIQEQVKINAKCPSCLQELSLSELRIIEEPNILTKKDEPEDKIVFDEPKLKDERHAAIVEYLTKYVSKTGEELSKVTEYSFRSSKGFIDLITYAVKNNIMNIKIYEVKSTIYDVGDTIRQIKRYANYVAGTKDKIFGAMKEKRIQTYLVLIDSKRNNKIFDDHFSTFLYSGIDYVIFINTLKEKVNVLPLTKISSSNL